VTSVEFRGVPQCSPPTAARAQTRLGRPGRLVSQRRRVARRAAQALLALVCLLTAVAVAGSMVGLWRIEPVLTGSMRPAIEPGDLEVFRTEPLGALHTGQIVAIYPPHSSVTVVHRVVAIRQRRGTWITTKADANRATDPWGSIRVRGSSVWVVRFAVPDAGYLSVWLNNPLVRAVLVLAVVLLAIVMIVESGGRAVSSSRRNLATRLHFTSATSDNPDG
jgi:signal peptidase I